MSLLSKIFHVLFAHDEPEAKSLSRDERFAKAVTRYNATSKEQLDPNSLKDTMKFFGASDEQTNMAERKKIAEYYGIKDYTGTAEQNKKWRDLVLDDFYGK